MKLSKDDPNDALGLGRDRRDRRWLTTAALDPVVASVTKTQQQP